MFIVRVESGDSVTSMCQDSKLGPIIGLYFGGDGV